MRGTVGKKIITKVAVRRVQFKRIPPSCLDCKGTDEMYGIAVCPRCMDRRREQDDVLRTMQSASKHLAVLIEVNGTMSEVDLNKYSTIQEKTRMVSHMDNVMRLFPIVPFYECQIMVAPGEPNELAKRVMKELNGFHDDSFECVRGNVLIRGPFGNSLKRSEVEKILSVTL